MFDDTAGQVVGLICHASRTHSPHAQTDHQTTCLLVHRTLAHRRRQAAAVTPTITAFVTTTAISTQATIRARGGARAGVVVGARGTAGSGKGAWEAGHQVRSCRVAGPCHVISASTGRREARWVLCCVHTTSVCKGGGPVGAGPAPRRLVHVLLHAGGGGGGWAERRRRPADAVHGCVLVCQPVPLLGVQNRGPSGWTTRWAGREGGRCTSMPRFMGVCCWGRERALAFPGGLSSTGYTGAAGATHTAAVIGTIRRCVVGRAPRSTSAMAAAHATAARALGSALRPCHAAAVGAAPGVAITVAGPRMGVGLACWNKAATGGGLVVEGGGGGEGQAGCLHTFNSSNICYVWSSMLEQGCHARGRSGGRRGRGWRRPGGAPARSKGRRWSGAMAQ